MLPLSHMVALFGANPLYRPNSVPHPCPRLSFSNLIYEHVAHAVRLANPRTSKFIHRFSPVNFNPTRASTLRGNRTKSGQRQSPRGSGLTFGSNVHHLGIDPGGGWFLNLRALLGPVGYGTSYSVNYLTCLPRSDVIIVIFHKS